MEHESFESRGDRRRAQPRLHLDQGRPRGAAGRRPRLHVVRAVDHRIRRLADERVPDARSEAVLRRHLLSPRPRAGDGPDSPTCSRSWRASGARIAGQGARRGGGIAGAPQDRDRRPTAESRVGGARRRHGGARRRRRAVPDGVRPAAAAGSATRRSSRAPPSCCSCCASTPAARPTGWRRRRRC